MSSILLNNFDTLGLLHFYGNRHLVRIWRMDKQMVFLLAMMDQLHSVLYFHEKFFSVLLLPDQVTLVLLLILDKFIKWHRHTS